MLNLSIFKKTKVVAAAVMGLMLGSMSAETLAATPKNGLVQGAITGTQIANARYISLDVKGKVTASGFTGATGTFSYRNGDTVSFYVGDVLLGKSVAKSSVPTSSLIDGAKNAEALANLLRFLQTIDSDLNPLNGIQISTGTHTAAKGLKVNFDAAMKSFEVQASLQKVLALATNSPTLPDAVEALTNFRMALLNAYDTNASDTVLNLMNTKWKGTFTSSDCQQSTASLVRTFNKLGHISAGFHNVTPKADGTCRSASASILMSLYENDPMFSCANGCTLEDLNSTVTLQYPTAHQATLVHQAGSNIITIIHQYDNGREVIETLVKQVK